MDILGPILAIIAFVFFVGAIIAATTWYKWRTWKYNRDLRHELDKSEQAHRHEMEGRTLLHDRGREQAQPFLYRTPDATEYPPMEAQPGAYEGIYPQQSQGPQPLG